jgi:hypothetical protein
VEIAMRALVKVKQLYKSKSFPFGEWWDKCHALAGSDAPDPENQLTKAMTTLQRLGIVVFVQQRDRLKVLVNIPNL